MAKKKGSGGYHDRDVGMCRFFLNEVRTTLADPARHSQRAAAVCTAQLTPDGGSLSLVVVKLPHAADETQYDEGFQRTPELESSKGQDHS